MAIAKKRSNSDDDFVKVGPDATATFDNSSSNPTEYASSENIDAVDDEDEEEEDIDEEEKDEEEYDEEDDDEEEYEDDDEEADDDEEDDDEDEDEDDEEEDHDPATGPKAPSVYRKV